MGFDIEQDREKGTVTLSMPRYINDAVAGFSIDTNFIDDSLGITIGNSANVKATEEQKKRIQQIVGVLLYYARAIRPDITGANQRQWQP